MTFSVKPSPKFQKDLKLAAKRGYDINKITAVIKLISLGEKLPAAYKDHALKGDYKGCRECHIQPDWLLIYEVQQNELILYLTRTGTHSDLFNK